MPTRSTSSHTHQTNRPAPRTVTRTGVAVAALTAALVAFAATPAAQALEPSPYVPGPDATAEASGEILRDLSAAPGLEDAAGLAAWADDRQDCWAAAEAAAPGDLARESEGAACRADTLAAIDVMNGMRGPAWMGQAQKVLVFFEPESAALTDGHGRAIVKAAAHMLENRSLRVEITGFAAPNEGGADEGSALTLARDRAETIAEGLLAEGVPEERMAVGARLDDAPDLLMDSTGVDGLADARARRVGMMIESLPATAEVPDTAAGDTLLAGTRDR